MAHHIRSGKIALREVSAPGARNTHAHTTPIRSPVSSSATSRGGRLLNLTDHVEFVFGPVIQLTVDDHLAPVERFLDRDELALLANV